MDKEWVFRRPHHRRLPRGPAVFVRGAWVIRDKDREGNAYKHTCPNCGADITSVRMPRGGWAHFEGRKGLTHLKHPCLHLGEKLSRRRDSKTLDLFDLGALQSEAEQKREPCDAPHSTPYADSITHANTKWRAS